MFNIQKDLQQEDAIYNKRPLHDAGKKHKPNYS